jgi:bifunctional NMN adenylyltransferase/nudix hydrolase
MKYKYGFAVCIGRFQPFHKAHQELVKHALTLAEKVILVLGSARSAPDIRNPWTPAMREEMIRACFPNENERLIFRAVRDYPYNDNFWIAEVQNSVSEAILDNSDLDNPEDALVALVGHFKDRTSYYLNLFPQWSFEDFWRSSADLQKTHAASLREEFFQIEAENSWKNRVPNEVLKFLERYQQSEIFAELLHEFDYIRKYKADTRFVGVPFDPVFVTTDAVVVQSGHILVVRRKFHPGKGLLALPGGFLLSGMTLEDSALRELKEETNIHVPPQILKQSIKASHIFDYPDRSQRGRTITQAFFIQLEASLKNGLPQVKGGDDAARAFWLPLSSLGEMEEQFFEDHIHIIRYFLGL